MQARHKKLLRKQFKNQQQSKILWGGEKKRSFTLSTKQRDYEYPNPNALQLSCVCSFHMLVMILGHHQILTILPSNRGMNQRPFAGSFQEQDYPTTSTLSGLITPTILPTDRPGSRRARSCCSGTRGLFPLLGRVILTPGKRRCSWL